MHRNGIYRSATSGFHLVSILDAATKCERKRLNGVIGLKLQDGMYDLIQSLDNYVSLGKKLSQLWHRKVSRGELRVKSREAALPTILLRESFVYRSRLTLATSFLCSCESYTGIGKFLLRARRSSSAPSPPINDDATCATRREARRGDTVTLGISPQDGIARQNRARGKIGGILPISHATLGDISSRKQLEESRYPRIPAILNDREKSASRYEIIGGVGGGGWRGWQEE